ncbi:MAG: methyltransferase domain-containing protein [Acidimicrobiia bacterium]|nr:methyltransferase domain-containing protein [Acidimicrobiia bacterium]
MTEQAHWYEPVAAFLGRAYLRNAFTLGTVQEVDWLLPRLRLDPTSSPAPRLLDAGCGPGRHTLEFARRGVSVTGIDIAPAFIEIARADAAAAGLDVDLRVGDLRSLETDGSYDAVVCLCEGGFGLAGGGVDADLGILTRLTAALRPGGHLALSAFSAFFAVLRLEEGDHGFDPASGLFHEVAELRNEAGETQRVEMHTRCYTPQELELMARIAGLEAEGIYGVDPGSFTDAGPTTRAAEFLLLARRARDHQDGR